MTTATVLLTQLRTCGAFIAVEGNELVVRAPRALLTPGLVAELQSHKHELVQLLRLEQQSLHTPLVPLPTRPCNACRGREWWWRAGAREWTCAACHPPAVPEEVVKVLAPLRTLRDGLESAALEYARAAGWPRLELQPHRAVAPGEAPWRIWARQAAAPDLRAAIRLLAQELGITLDEAAT